MRAAASLVGLSVADALGSQFFVPENRSHFDAQTLLAGSWPWTDDTEMAGVLVSHLERHGEVRQDELARGFAAGFDLYRGYGPGAGRLLRLIRDGGDWRTLSADMFGGTGSLGNGAAMRVAPWGARFADLDVVVEQAALSAAITHAHPEGEAGAIAIAVAAAIAGRDEPATADELLAEVAERTLVGKVLAVLQTVRRIPMTSEPRYVAAQVGNGSNTTASDTVPLCLWIAAHHLGDYRRAFWSTAGVGGDIDINCAIVGGIVAARTGIDGIPGQWLANREPLPSR